MDRQRMGGWQDGSRTVVLAGMFLALFAGSDNPTAPIKGFMVGTLIASALAVYG